MKQIKTLSILALFIALQSCNNHTKENDKTEAIDIVIEEQSKSSITGTLIKYVDFESVYVDPRNVDI